MHFINFQPRPPIEHATNKVIEKKPLTSEEIRLYKKAKKKEKKKMKKQKKKEEAANNEENVPIADKKTTQQSKQSEKEISLDFSNMLDKLLIGSVRTQLNCRLIVQTYMHILLSNLSE